MDSTEENAAPRAIEAPVMEAMERIISQPSIRGVLISDKEGLCVGYRDSIHPSNSGRLTNIFEAALKMAPEQVLEGEDGHPIHVPEQPIVIIDTDQGSLLTSYLDGFCTTVAKSHNTTVSIQMHQ